MNSPIKRIINSVVELVKVLILKNILKLFIQAQALNVAKRKELDLYQQQMLAEYVLVKRSLSNLMIR
jgi:hypothetical protein